MDRYTLSEFENYSEAYPDSLFELIDGEIVEKLLWHEHRKIARNLLEALETWQKKYNIQGYADKQIRYRVRDDNYNERRADTSFHYKNDEPLNNETPIYITPDFIVETKYSENSADDLREKAKFYLGNGTRLVWLVFPRIHVVEVHNSDGTITLLSDNETIVSGGDVLPNFEMKISEIFRGFGFDLNWGRPHFTWDRGYKLDTDRILHMQSKFPKPDKLPYVAWFMSGVEYHTSIEHHKILSEWDLTRYLEDTGAGISSFGRLKIWVDWFHHLLPFLIKKASKSDTLIFEIINFLERLYLYDMFEEYLGFRNDVFDTLGQIIMQDRFWKNGDLKKPDWAEELDKWEPEWYEEDILYISLQLCIKYLGERDIPHWIKSIADIDGKIWTTQIRYWVKKFKKSPASYNIPYERAQFFLNELRKYPAYADL